MSDMSSSTISIDAPLDQVAATLFAIADYPQWSGAFKKVDVLESDGQGRATKATLSVDAGAVKDVVTLNFEWSEAPGKVTFSLEDANILTKMDGSAKGGIALAIERECGIPIKFIGTGEAATDLEAFDPERYLNGLFN